MEVARSQPRKGRQSIARVARPWEPVARRVQPQSGESDFACSVAASRLKHARMRRIQGLATLAIDYRRVAALKKARLQNSRVRLVDRRSSVTPPEAPFTMP